MTNLAATVTADDVKRLCSVIGAVRSVSRHEDSALVEMSSEQDVTLCVQRLSGHIFKGRELVLERRATAISPNDRG